MITYVKCARIFVTSVLWGATFLYAQASPVLGQTSDPGVERECLQAASASEYQARWDSVNQNFVHKMINANQAERLREIYWCSTPDGAFLDLRGLTLRDLVVRRGNFTLEGASFAYGRLERVRFVESYAPRLIFHQTSLQLVVFKGADISNSVFRNLRIRKGDLQLDSVLALSTMWLDVNAPGLRITQSSFLNSVFRNSDFSEGAISKSHLREVTIENVSFRKSQFMDVSYASSYSANTSWEYAVLREVDFSGSHFLHPNFSNVTAKSVRALGIYLEQPVIGPSGIDLFDWRFVVWRDFLLGDEAALESRWRRLNVHRDLSALDHRTVALLYDRLSSRYRETGVREYANGFRYQHRRFQRLHQPPGIRYARFWIEEFLDRYGTSGAALSRAFLISLLVLTIAFFAVEILSIKKRHRLAWTLVGEANGNPVFTRSRYAALRPIRLLALSIVVALASLLMFAERVLNTEGILTKVGLGTPHYEWLARPLAAVGGIWGLFMAIRGLALLT